MKAIVLAGGGGTRLWPLSREDFPKQFLKFDGNLSLLQRTVVRLVKAPFIEEIVVSTNTHHLRLVEEQLQKLNLPNKVQILLEPCRKNTAPAIALAVKYLQEHCQAKETDPILVLPSDHLIDPESIFLDALEQMDTLARKEWLITFGIRPTRAETGYGYIQIGAKKETQAFTAVRFVEKPDAITAQQYLSDPNFYWNAGIFLFSANTFWKQLEKHAPQIYELSHSLNEMMERFPQMPNLSIDYAIMEKSSEILTCPIAAHWSDIGSWDSVYDVLAKDQNQNVKIGKVFDLDTKNSLIIGGKRLISTIGVQDLLIIETETAIFIGKKGESQRVKELVEQLSQLQNSPAAENR